MTVQQEQAAELDIDTRLMVWDVLDEVQSDISAARYDMAFNVAGLKAAQAAGYEPSEAAVENFQDAKQMLKIYRDRRVICLQALGRNRRAVTRMGPYAPRTPLPGNEDFLAQHGIEV